MEMKLNQQLIRQLRLERTWSQAQLAEVSGLSKRTIQRIEKHGQASMESARSLAAVFETQVNELEVLQKPGFHLWPLPLVFVIVVGVFYVLPAAAEKIMLNVILTEQGNQLADVQLLNNQNKVSEIKLGQDLKLTFLSQVTEDGFVLITVNVFEREGEVMKLVAEPAIMTEQKRPAVIQLDDLSITLEATL